MDQIEKLAAAITTTDPDFAAMAVCNDGTGQLGTIFFSDEIPDIRRAKQICRGCPVRIVCLQGAGDRREPAGVWGAELFVNGKILPVKRPRGRPPKHKEALTA